MARARQRNTLVAEINITPFTDVILVLLIIFIVATPLISQNQIEVKLPSAASGTPSTAEVKKSVITVTKDGAVYLDGAAAEIASLSETIKVLVSANKNHQVSIAVDKDCPFQQVVSVIDALKKSGVSNLNISTTAGQN
jgi:biopolymer transport protein ExbD